MDPRFLSRVKGKGSDLISCVEIKMEGPMENVSVIGIDLAKRVFELCGVNHTGRVVLRKSVKRDRLLESVTSLLVRGGTVAMEACGSSNYWGRVFEAQGYRVKLIAPQHVAPFRKSQKNDCNDAEAIVEAAQRPTMRFVELKSQRQLELQSLVRIREQIVGDRTALVNELHGILQEHGIESPRGVGKLKSFCETLLFESQELSGVLRSILGERLAALKALSDQLAFYTKQIKTIAQEHPLCRLAMTVPGVGPIGAVAFIAAISRPNSFPNGRNFAAWLGLVPRQFSSGGKTSLGRITKRGDCFLRKTLVHGARAVLFHASRKTDSLSLWVVKLKERKGMNLATVALANKLARILCSVLKTQTPYQPLLTA